MNRTGQGSRRGGGSPLRSTLASFITAGFLAALPARAAEPVVLYSTGFERSEGYSTEAQELPLRGQKGWLGEGSGGNGIVTNFFEGAGQQAFIGFTPPALKDEVLSVWRPFNAPRPDPLKPVWKFSVWMQIVDSTNGQYDDFRWSAYNTEGRRLFTLDFENSSTEINYALDDTNGFLATGFTFNTEVIYQLEIWMNFARNNWQAVMNGQVIVNAQPITTTGARLDLSDIGAVWAVRRKGQAGDNYLLFDDYTLTIEPVDHIPATLELLGFNERGAFELFLHGERARRFSLDVTSDFVTWTSLGTNRLDAGSWYFLDTSAPDYDFGFYRAREIVP
jgi:hypothetical protein